MTQITLPHKFIYRDYQKPFFRAMHNGYKRAVLVWHRRAGKDKCAWNHMISCATEKVGIYYYFFPTFSQGRKALWDNIDKDGFKSLDHIPKELLCAKNNSEMKIRLVNGSLIQIIGTDNFDSIMGTNPVGCVFSEYSLQDPEAWQHIRPILDENEGWAVFVFTPRGSNHAKQLFDMASREENKKKWFCEKLTVDDTGAVSEGIIEEARKEETTEDMIQQEYYCSFIKGMDGSYFAKYVEKIRDLGQICNVYHDSQIRVNTAWDLGYADSTSIIWYQICGKEIRIIDHYENHGEPLSHYVQVINDKKYIYDRHFAPHDINAKSLSAGQSSNDVARQLGLDFTVLETLKKSHEQGIEAARGIFPRIWIDEKKCSKLIKALQNYRSEFDPKKEIYKPKPIHDKYSHSADAFRYLALAVKAYVDRDITGVSDADDERYKDIFQPRFT